MQQLPDIAKLVQNQHILMFFGGILVTLYIFEKVYKFFWGSGKKEKPKEEESTNPGDEKALANVWKKVNGHTQEIANHNTAIVLQENKHENLCQNFGVFLAENKDQHKSIFDKLDKIFERLPLK